MAAVALSLSVPAVVQLRQASALQALRALLPEAAWLSPAAAETLMDVKAAMRHALTPLLAEELGLEVHTVVTDAQIMRIVHGQRQGPKHMLSAIASNCFLGNRHLCAVVRPCAPRATARTCTCDDLSGDLVLCLHLPPCLARRTFT